MPVLLHGLIQSGQTRSADAPEHTLIACGPFSALVSPTPPGLTQLPPQAIAELALKHHAILVAYCTTCAVLPLRFGAAFSSVGVVRQHVLADAAGNLRALTAVADLCEYTVRLTVFLEPPLVGRTVTTGREFLLKGLELRDRRKTVTAGRTDLARRLMEGLNPLTRQMEAAGTTKPERLIDLAILLQPARLDQLMALASEVAAAAAPLGLQVDVKGPWPAYSFKPEQSAVCHGA